MATTRRSRTRARHDAKLPLRDWPGGLAPRVSREDASHGQIEGGVQLEDGLGADVAAAVRGVQELGMGTEGNGGERRDRGWVPSSGASTHSVQSAASTMP